MESKIRERFMSDDQQYLTIKRYDYSLQETEAGNDDQTWLYLDLETTGLDARSDKIIEIGAILFQVNLGSSKITKILEEYNEFQDPGIPIPAHITKLTGIDDSMVAGKNMDHQKVKELLTKAQIVISHNAVFDRAFLDPIFKESVESVWACSMVQIPWRSFGFPCKSLAHLCMEHGFFYDGHRALHDVKAALNLLNTDGQSYFQILNNESSKKSYLVEAISSPFESKDLLKARQFRWDPTKRVWYKQVSESEVDELQLFFENEIYSGKSKARFSEVAAQEKFRS